MRYAIPSRARAITLATKTIPLLERLGVDPADVSVFVAPVERDLYETTLASAGEFGAAVRVEDGAVGMCAQRNAIHAHYGDGARFVTIDDDMRDLVVRAGEKRLLSISADEWADVVEEAFAITDRVGARVWGLYPVPNPFFMKPRVRTDLSYIGGGLFGIVNRLDDVALVSELEYRDDWERSVKCYLADGAVVRVEYVSWRTEGYAGAGGMQTGGDRTPEATLADCRELVRRYPDLVSLNLTKKSGRPETRLRDSRPVGQETLA